MGQTIVHNFLISEKRWKLWKEEVDQIDKSLEIPLNSKFNEITIPTIETMKTNNILRIMINNNVNGVFIGPTGTGKTLYVSRYLKSLPKDLYMTIFLCLSAKTH